MAMVSPAESSLEAAYLLEVTTLAATWARRMLLVEDVEDIAQDVMLDCLMHLRAGKPMVDARARNLFVRGIVKHRIIDDLRATERRDWREVEYARELDTDEHLWMSPDRALDTRELQHVIALTIDGMPVLRQRVYLLADDDETTHESVAEALGMTLRAVRGHVGRAQRQLRAVLLEYLDRLEVVPTKAKRRRPRHRSLQSVQPIDPTGCMHEGLTNEAEHTADAPERSRDTTQPTESRDEVAA